MRLAKVGPRETCKSEFENINRVIGQSEIQKDEYLRSIQNYGFETCTYRLAEARPRELSEYDRERLIGRVRRSFSLKAKISRFFFASFRFKRTLQESENNESETKILSEKLKFEGHLQVFGL